MFRDQILSSIWIWWVALGLLGCGNDLSGSYEGIGTVLSVNSVQFQSINNAPQAQVVKSVRIDIEEVDFNRYRGSFFIQDSGVQSHRIDRSSGALRIESYVRIRADQPAEGIVVSSSAIAMIASETLASESDSCLVPIMGEIEQENGQISGEICGSSPSCPQVGMICVQLNELERVGDVQSMGEINASF